MEREIKFRAFWKDTGKIILGFNEEYIIDACNDNIFIVEQFTGLKDKNGVDIYEGDILNIGTVVFERGTFGVYPEYTDEFVPVAEWSSESRQIIGSIHQQKNALTIKSGRSDYERKTEVLLFSYFLTS